MHSESISRDTTIRYGNILASTPRRSITAVLDPGLDCVRGGAGKYVKLTFGSVSIDLDVFLAYNCVVYHEAKSLVALAMRASSTGGTDDSTDYSNGFDCPRGRQRHFTTRTDGLHLEPSRLSARFLQSLHNRSRLSSASVQADIATIFLEYDDSDGADERERLNIALIDLDIAHLEGFECGK